MLKIERFIWLAALPLLCPGWARADVVTSPDFFIQLFNPPDTPGWTSGQKFTVTGSSTTTNTAGFFDGSDGQSFCPSGNWYECYCSSDPGTKLNGGGDAIPFNSNVGATITFTTNPTTVDYVNVGPNLESVMITVTIVGQQLNEQYTCSSDIFAFCGFQVIDPPRTEELEILFTNGDIPTAVPEPRQYVLLLIAACACIALEPLRRRRARA